MKPRRGRIGAPLVRICTGLRVKADLYLADTLEIGLAGNTAIVLVVMTRMGHCERGDGGKDQYRKSHR